MEQPVNMLRQHVMEKHPDDDSYMRTGIYIAEENR